LFQQISDQAGDDEGVGTREESSDHPQYKPSNRLLNIQLKKPVLWKFQ